MTACRDGFCDKIDLLSSDRSAFRAQLDESCRQLSAVRAEFGSVRGQLTEQNTLDEKVEQKVDDLQYEPDWANAKIVQFRGSVH